MAMFFLSCTLHIYLCTQKAGIGKTNLSSARLFIFTFFPVKAILSKSYELKTHLIQPIISLRTSFWDTQYKYS